MLVIDIHDCVHFLLNSQQVRQMNIVQMLQGNNHLFGIRDGQTTVYHSDIEIRFALYGKGFEDN